MSVGDARNDTARRARGLDTAVAAAVAGSDGIADAGERVLGAIAEALDFQAGVLWRVGPAGQQLVPSVTWAGRDGLDGFIEDSRGRVFSPDDGLPGRVWSTGTVLWYHDLTDAAVYRRAASAAEAGVRSAVGIPLVSHGRLIGVMELLSDETLEEDAELTAVFEGLGRQVGELMDRIYTDAALAESDARKAAVLEASLDAILTGDAEGRILEANRAATELLGWLPDEMVGRRVAELLVPPELRERHEAGLRRFAESGESDLIGTRFETEAMHRDGSRVPVELTINRVRLPGPPLLTVFVRDLSERRQIEEERARLLASETAARLSAQAAWSKLRLVSDVSEMLARTFAYPEAFERLAERTVLDIADLCLVDIVDERGAITRVAARHRDPSLQPLADRLREEFAPNQPTSHPAPHVIQSGITQFSPVMSEQFLRATCINEEHFRIVRRLGFQSYITVPLAARERVLGALTLVSTDPERRYDREDVAVAEELARRAAVRIDNARLYQERDRVAHVLQQGLLPRMLPEVPRLDLAARYFPAGEGLEAGGDFYDVFAAGDDRWALVIGDVCGKGPEAAAGMGLARPALRALARAYRSPSRLLRALNQELLDQISAHRFVTVAYVQAQPRKESGLTLTACLGGHAPALLAGSGRVRDVGLKGTLLGIVPRVSLSEQRTHMRQGELLLLYTDGLGDEVGSPAPFTHDDLRTLLLRMAGASAEQVAIEIEHQLRERRRGSRWADDVAYLVARCTE
jgi:PAS domain S-box-containing protein